MSDVAIPIQTEQDDDKSSARRSQAVPIIASDELVRRAQQRVPQAVPLEDKRGDNFPKVVLDGLVIAGVIISAKVVWGHSLPKL